jgi:predicted Zn-dependent protease
MRRLALVLLMGCSQSPTGRTEIILVSDQQMTEMGTEAFAQLRQETPESTDQATKAYVDCVANALVAVTETEADWEIVLFDQPDTVNAFALPGGKIGVFTGLLEVASTPGELAAVIGHEISHVTARHSAERVSQDMLIDLSVSTVAAIFGDGVTGSAAIAALGVGSQVGVVLPFTRVQESEADELGQQLMAQAGFDPRDALTLWMKMAQLGGSGVPAILSDHPSDEERVADLMKTLPMAQAMYDASRATNCQR